MIEGMITLLETEGFANTLVSVQVRFIPRSTGENIGRIREDTNADTPL
jgi:hypothetical protein